MAGFKTLDQIGDIKGKRVLVRVDLNVPTADGKVTDTTRIERVAPTIKELSDKGARVVLLAHFGRPKGGPDPEFSLEPIARATSDVVGRSVTFIPDTIGERAQGAIFAMNPGDIALLENTRFDKREEKNDPAFTAELAKNGDIFVNDAFSAAHRAHSSTEGLAHLLPAYAGRTMQAELEALEKGLGNPAKPVIAIVGGAKVSTKIELLRNLVRKVATLTLGGAMANTFLAAQGNPIGKSLAERDMLGTARSVIAASSASGCEIVLPIDAVVAQESDAGAAWSVVPVQAVGAEEMILDIGPDTVTLIGERLAGARTLVWNGPLGAFETTPFDRGTTAIARTVAGLTRTGALRSVAGDGDTVAALKHAGVASDFTFVSTAGGAFLEWFEGKSLPGIEALRAI